MSDERDCGLAKVAVAAIIALILLHVIAFVAINKVTDDLRHRIEQLEGRK